MILVIKITEKEFDDFSPDFLNSLDTNISNSLIKKIIIFVNFPYFNLNKLKTIVIQNNGTDVDLLKQVCKIYPNKTIIWSNKFAKFDNTLSKLNKVDLIENLVYVNSKFDGKENKKSLDALIFNSNSKIEYSDNIIDSIMSKKISLDINVINKKPDINTEKVMLKVLKQSPRRISIKNYETIITKKEIYKLSVIIVSVNYNDYLLVSLSNNIKYFEDITVVTSSDDLVCQKICDIFGVKCIITDRIYEEGASFNKGKAINDGIKSIDNPDWILLLDADIVLTKKIDINDDVDVLYTSDRYICKDYNTYKDWQGGKIEIDKVGKYETNRGLGFFHLFNINSSDINKELPFPESSNDASWSDLHFRDKFTKKSKIDKSVIHLGPTYKNWKGRKTDAFLSDDLFNELYNKQGKTFTICSYYFNFNDDIRQKNNFIKFLEQFKDYHDKMIVGIVDYGDIDFEIPCESIIIKGDPNNKLWSKEIIINKIANRISTDYLIWMDGDLIYENLDWLNNIENVVGKNDFVQLFEDINYLGDNGEILESHKSIISSSSKNIDKLLKKEYKPGGSWLVKTSILKNNNLFEKMYVGGGDTILVYGLFGVNNGLILKQVGKGNEEIQDEATRWINKFEEYKVGYLNETVNHLYHGDLKDRNYIGRYKELSRFKEFIELKYEEFEYDFCIIITTYNRPKMLKYLLEDIEINSLGKRVLVTIFDDGSNVDYYLDKYDLKYVKYVNNNGKINYWKLISDTFKYCAKIKSKYYIYLPDDIRLKNNFLEESIRIFEKIEDENKICLNILMDESRRGNSNWTGFTPIEYDEYYKTQWNDLCFISKFDFFKKLNFEILPIDKNRWIKNSELGSGVGQQMSIRLMNLNQNMYHVKNTLVTHDDHESVMNYSNRKKIKLIAK